MDSLSYNLDRSQSHALKEREIYSCIDTDMNGKFDEMYVSNWLQLEVSITRLRREEAEIFKLSWTN